MPEKPRFKLFSNFCLVWILGGIGATLAFFLLMVDRFANEVLFSDQSSGLYSDNSLEYKLQGFIGCPTCMGGVATQTVRFDYPILMRIDESRVASLFFQPVLKEEQSLAIQLSGPNFDLKPSESQKIDISFSHETKVSWLIQPKQTGEHVLLLDLSNLAKQHSFFYFVANRIEGPDISRPLRNQADAIIELPVRVATIWGISRRLFDIMKAMIAVMAFVLATPLAYTLLKGAWIAVFRLSANEEK